MLGVILRIIFIATILVLGAQQGDSGLVDGGAYRIQNLETGLHMTTQTDKADGSSLSYVVTDAWVFSKEQNWGVEFSSSYKTLSPAANRQNNVTLEMNSGSSFLTSILYTITEGSPNEYTIKNKKNGLCLIEESRMVQLGSCGGSSSIWKFFRVG